MALVNVQLQIEDGRGETSTLNIPIQVLVGGLAAIPAIVAYITKNVARVIQGGLRSARACIQLDVSAIWLTYSPSGDAQGGLAEVNEKALLSFRTEADSNGRTYASTVTLPAVDDNIWFVPASDSADLSDPNVQAVVDLFTTTITDLSDPEFGGQVTDSFKVVDSRGLAIETFVGSDRTWGNRRK